MMILGLNNTTLTSLTEWQDLRSIETLVTANVNTYLAGSMPYILGVLVFVVFMVVAFKSRFTLDTAAAVFIPLVFMMSVYSGYLPVILQYLMWAGAFVLVAIGIIRVLE